VISTARIYEMLGNESLWDIALLCHQIFEAEGISHSICGDVAVCIHGYQRNTTDVDWIINAADSAKFKELLIAASFEWDDELKEFITCTHYCGLPFASWYIELLAMLPKVAATLTAVSTRKILSPKSRMLKPASTACEISCFVNPPSGPTANTQR